MSKGLSGDVRGSSSPPLMFNVALSLFETPAESNGVAARLTEILPRPLLFDEFPPAVHMPEDD